MPSPFFQSVFDSSLASPQLSYRDTIQFVKDEAGEFMDYLDPFASPGNPLDITRLRQELESSLTPTSDLNLGASFSAVSPLLTPDALSSSANSTFDSDSRTGVDDAFINQISCFSDLSAVHSDSSSCSFASPSSSQNSASISKPAIDATAAIDPTKLLLDNSARYQRQIFARSSPWVLSDRPVDAEAWVECSGPVAFCGRMTNISGWEPPENDMFPFVDVDLKQWMPWAPVLLSEGSRINSGPAKSGGPEPNPKHSSSSKPPQTEVRKCWGRREASNRPVTEVRKKRRVETVLYFPEQATDKEDNPSFEFQSCLVNNELDSSGNGDNTKPSDAPARTQTPVTEAPASKSEGGPHVNIPGYIYPQPDVAKAITQRAAEDERQRGLAATARLFQELKPDNEDDEAACMLVDQFFSVADDVKKQLRGDGCIVGDPLTNAFDPTRLSSPSPGSGIGGRQSLRPTRSLLDYSTSSRRRALVRSRSDVLPKGAVPLIRKFAEEANDRQNEEGLDAFPLTQHLLEEDALTAQRGTKRVRAS